MNRDELRALIDSANKVLHTLQSYNPEFEEYIDYPTISILQNWLSQMDSDISSGFLPDFHISYTEEDIKPIISLIVKPSREEMNAYFEDCKARHRTIQHKEILNTSLSRAHIYKVLRSINFAQNNCVIVGPNGCGKTTLANIFTQSVVHSQGIVIPAQKLLIVPEIKGIPWPNEVDKAYQEYQTSIADYKTTYEYKNSDSLPYDFVSKNGKELQYVILQFLAEWNNVKTNVFNAVREGGETNSSTKIDEAIEIWNDLMQERKLCLDEKDHFVLSFCGKRYPAHRMSEGEREILYLIGRVLFAPKESYIIVDEPEVYLHKTIVNKLWDKLENKRCDCKFIYMTHDLDFASTRIAEKCWIRRFRYPHEWEIEPLLGSEMPEELLLTILGSRKKILFCEGTKGSTDKKVYEILFPDFTIIPLESCSQVISYTKAFNGIPNRLVDAFGIIDRDVRPDAQIEAFKANNIYSYDVSEIENIFLVEDFVRGFASYYHSEERLNGTDFKERIISKFKDQIEKHSLDYVSAMINFYYDEQKFHTGRTLDEIKTSYESFCKAIDVNQIYQDRKDYLEHICREKDYSNVIKAVNNKGLCAEIGQILKIPDYSERALQFLAKTDAKKFIIGLFPHELLS